MPPLRDGAARATGVVRADVGHVHLHPGSGPARFESQRHRAERGPPDGAGEPGPGLAAQHRHHDALVRQHGDAAAATETVTSFSRHVQ